MLRLFFILLCSAPLAAPTLAQAPSAGALIDEGVTLREQGRDAEALERFERAHAMTPSSHALAQIALAEQALGRWVVAHAHLRDALETGGPWVEPRRATLERALAIIRSHLGRLELLDGVAGAQVRVNGEAAGTLPLAEALYVPSGTVVLEVSAPGRVPIERTIQVAPGSLARERVPLVAREDRPVESSAAGPIAAEPIAEPPAPHPGRSGPSGELVGATVASGSFALAGGAVMAIFGALALGEEQAIRAGCGRERTCTPADLADAQAFALAADIGLGALLAGAAVGAVLLGLSLHSASEAGHARVAPWIAPDGAGVLARGSF